MSQKDIGRIEIGLGLICLVASGFLVKYGYRMADLAVFFTGMGVLIDGVRRLERKGGAGG